MSIVALQRPEPGSAENGPEKIDFPKRAAELRSLIEEEAAKPENGHRTPLAVVEAVRQAGLFWHLVPKSLGGSDTGMVPFATVIEELASADSSVGWTIAAQSIAIMVAANFCTDDHVARMFGGKRMPIMSATYAPTGKARYESGFYVGSGRYSFGTGIDHADWVGSALVVDENGQTVMQADGRPRVVGAFVPKDEVRVVGNWNVAGMQATGSYDYELPEHRIPEDWTFNQYWTEPMRQSRASSVGTLVAVCAGHTAVALGIARRSLHESAKAANAKKRLYSAAAIAETPTFKLDFVRHEALYQAARALSYALFRNADRKTDAGETLTEAEIQQIRQVTTWTHQVCRDVCVYAYGSVSSSLRSPSILARNMADVAVAAQHFIVSDMSMMDAAPSVIDRWSDDRAKNAA